MTEGPKYTPAELWSLLKIIKSNFICPLDHIRRTYGDEGVEGYVRSLEEDLTPAFTKILFEDNLEDLPLQMEHCMPLMKKVALWRLKVGK
ncbi:MAG: hypothetical protein GF334_02095 [Candidatus Altiarchaeales archaeon]|nr:hypothetical protein [Candidatus Altiarchaeales archaeon]